MPSSAGPRAGRPWTRCATARAWAASSHRGLFRSVDELVRLERLAVDLVERRDLVVPFEQGRRDAAQARRVRIELPDRVEHGVVVRVEDVLLELGVAGDVHLAHSPGAHTPK